MASSLFQITLIMVLVKNKIAVAIVASAVIISACSSKKKKVYTIEGSQDVHNFITSPAAERLTDPHDSLIYSFVTVGCNRIDKDDISEDNPSTTNLEEIKKTFEEVANMKPLPDYFFFTGDLVYGYPKFDTTKLSRELTGWRQVYENSPLAKTGIKMVALPGNHEMLISKKTSTGIAEENIWTRIMAPYIAGSNGPKRGGKDSLDADESRLDYSFDFKGSHFIMLNTDAMGQECKGPVYWIDDDMTSEQAKKPQHIFVFSHIPAYGAPEMNGPGEQLQNDSTFWDVLEKHHVDAMFSAHNHVYCRLLPHKGKTTMLMAGNGGSPLNEHCTEAQKFYGYTLVKVYKSGKVLSYSYGRPVPKAGYMAPVDAPTVCKDSANISWGAN